MRGDTAVGFTRAVRWWKRGYAGVVRRKWSESGNTGIKKGGEERDNGYERWIEKRIARRSARESHDRHLCSPRLHLTFYEPMKWLNHFTTDVYNAIDPYLFITPVYSSPRLSFLLSHLVFSSLPGRKVTFLLRLRIISRRNKFNMCRGDAALRFYPHRHEYGTFHLWNRVLLKLHIPV